VNQLARAFERHPARFKAALANGFEEPKSRDRHSAFNDDSEDEILTWIEVQIEKSRPMTRTDLRAMIFRLQFPITQREIHMLHVTKLPKRYSFQVLQFCGLWVKWASDSSL
jgi:hypothetical protein